MDFLEALAGAASTSVWGPAGTADQMILALDAAIEAEERECPFAVGDFVTPREGCGTKGRGRPWKVVEVFPARRDYGLGRGEPGAIQNMGLAVRVDGELLLYLDHSNNFEPFNPEKVGA